MRKLLKVLAAVTITLGIGSISLAQDAGPQGGQLEARKPGMRGPGALRAMERIQHDVLASMNLTDDQRKKIDDLNRQTQSEVAQILKQNKGTEGNKNVGSQRRKVMQEYNTTMQEILTPEQWKEYREKMMAEMKELREKAQARKQAQNGDDKKGDDMGKGRN